MGFLDELDFGEHVRGAKNKQEIEKALLRATSKACIVEGTPTRERLDEVGVGHMAIFEGAINSIFSTVDGMPITEDISVFFSALSKAKNRRIRSATDLEQWLRDKYKNHPRDAQASVQAAVQLDQFQLKPTAREDLSRGDRLFVAPTEFFIQSGNRYTAPHYDYGCVLSYIPPFCENCVKIWVSIPHEAKYPLKRDAGAFLRMVKDERSSVIVQRPGDVVYQATLSLHSVILGYTKDPAVDELDQASSQPR